MCPMFRRFAYQSPNRVVGSGAFPMSLGARDPSFFSNGCVHLMLYIGDCVPVDFLPRLRETSVWPPSMSEDPAFIHLVFVLLQLIS